MVTSDLLTPYGNVALRKQGTQRKGYQMKRKCQKKKGGRRGKR